MISLGLVMAFIGAAVAMMIGITIFGAIDDTINCESLHNESLQIRCDNTKDMAWTVIGIFPVILFFVMFAMFGGTAIFEGGRGRPNFRTVTIGGRRIKRYIDPRKFNFLTKILVVIGLAKVKKVSDQWNLYNIEISNSGMENLFKLKVGMHDQILWRELERVGISGETSKEVLVFKDPEKDHFEHGQPMHNVIMSNDHYAVLRKINSIKDPFGSIIDHFSYFLAGINDEHKYFIRPLKKLPKWENITLQKIVDWVNRIDQNFDGRIQGDVLFKLIDITKDQLIDVGKTDHRFDEIEDELDTVVSQDLNPFGIGILQPQHRLGNLFPTQSQPTQKQRRTVAQRHRRALLGASIMDRHLRSGEAQMEIEGMNYRKITENPVKLGNHKLFTEGKVYVCETEPFVAVVAETVVLQHYEHQIVEKKIPKNNVLVLAAQRGRDFQLKDYLKKAFD